MVELINYICITTVSENLHNFIKLKKDLKPKSTVFVWQQKEKPKKVDTHNHLCLLILGIN